jgi:putative colanic acid biosynthesis acetyltransferase WcaF
MDTTPQVNDRKGRPNPWTLKQRIGRVLWAIVQATLFRWSPHPFYAWRAMLLRAFGAKLGKGVLIRPSVRITIPWNLTMGDYAVVGDFAILYCLGPITMGAWSTVSQYSHLCSGTHDASNRHMYLVTQPIVLGDDSWVAADAFVGPGVTIGDRAIVGARSSVFKDVPADTVVGGNPAKFIKDREFTP